MKRVLVTGMSGVGKSTLLAELAARGHATIDTDYGDFHEIIDGERLWRREPIEAALGRATGDDTGVLFVQGTVRNQGSFYPWFDHIVLLSAPAHTLIERLTTRTTNPYGKDPAQLTETLHYLHSVEPLLRASATLEVVTTIPVANVADIVLAHVR
jgi:dephospho-CoA kinase